MLITLYATVFLLAMLVPQFSLLAVLWAMSDAADVIRNVLVSHSLGSVVKSQWLSYFAVGLMMIGLFLLPQYFRRQDRKTILLSPFGLWALTLVHAVGVMVWLVSYRTME